MRVVASEVHLELLAESETARAGSSPLPSPYLSGRVDITDRAETMDWIIVDMNKDWKVVFPEKE